jgi:hypothetical protein
MRAKGSILLDYVRIIRANKDLNWNRHLRPEDWEIINSKILPSQWYPLETYRRVGNAVFREVAKSNLETTRQFGRFNIKNVLQIYKNILVPGNPVKSVSNYIVLQKTFIDDNTDKARVAAQGQDSLLYDMTNLSEVYESAELEQFSYQIAGNLEALVEEATGKKAKATITRKPDGFEILVKWG